MISEETFTIGGAGGGVEEFLVVDSGATPAVEEDRAAQVAGVVTEDFDVVTFEEYLGVDLDDDLYADWEGQNYLVATEVTPTT